MKTSRSASLSQPLPALRRGIAAALLLSVALAAGGLQAATRSAGVARVAPDYWQDVLSTPAEVSAQGAEASLKLRQFRAVTLDRRSIAAQTASAPSEKAMSARRSGLLITLPAPDGSQQRFSLVESPVMAPELAARHPDIKTYAGVGLDDKAATLRMDITPLGLHASVRSPSGGWYIDPYYHLDDSLYASYYRKDLINSHAPLIEADRVGEPQLSVERSMVRAGDLLTVRGAGFAPGATVRLNITGPAASGAPAREVEAVADAEGVVSVQIVADSSRAYGDYQVTAGEGEQQVQASYQVVAAGLSPNVAVGAQLRTYRLALLTDPSYATYFGGAANVTAAKVTLVNRVTQIYEDETSIRLQLIGGNDTLNLDTAAQMTGTNGPCGGAACYSASQAGSCGSSTLTRTRQVIGLLVGASNFDIGHIALGTNGGGIASLGVVGGNSKAQGCTGITQPVGDGFAVDYVAHEMGHQFNGEHTFNGTQGNCSTGNRNGLTSVEPGSGSSIMAYAGICSTDNLQPHSDAYWSQRSFDEIVGYTSAAEGVISEVQLGVLSGFTSNGLQFQIRRNGADSAPIVRGTNFTTAGIKTAIEAIAGWPTGGTVTISALTDNAFTITFGGTLAGTAVNNLELVACSGGCTGKIGEVAAGGPTQRRGIVTAAGNAAPLVAATASYTIPVRTPFALTGAASDADGDPITYMWEQNDAGPSGTTAGTGLVSNTKLNGPLFRQFGTRAVVSNSESQIYESPSANHVDGNPTRVFPDMLQILANNTNAETGACPTASATPTAEQIDCFSEFLPTAAYVGAAGINASPASLNFKLTARDSRGGVNSTPVQLILASGAGPFLVTSPNTALTLNGGSAQTITWNVANTHVAPVGTSNVRITLSTDGGLTFPLVLAASTPNDGSESVALPKLASSKARVRIEAVGNVFFDVSNADFTIRLVGDLNGDAAVDCADLAIVRAAMGRRTGQPGFDPRADANNDGVVDIRDLSLVSQQLASGTVCR